MSTNAAAPEPKFQLIQASREGLPALIMVNTSLNPDVDEEAFPWLVTISIPIVNMNQARLCDDRESQRLNAFEDALLSGMESGAYRYVGHITWNGIRDVLLYVAKPEQAVEHLNRQMQLSDSPNTKVHVATKHDPEWKVYRKYSLARN